jgi:hypothetical protein
MKFVLLFTFEYQVDFSIQFMHSVAGLLANMTYLESHQANLMLVGPNYLIENK